MQQHKAKVTKMKKRWRNFNKPHPGEMQQTPTIFNNASEQQNPKTRLLDGPFTSCCYVFEGKTTERN